jgi:hypothetical protein
MAQATITIDNLSDGQEIEVPYEVTGSASVPAGTTIQCVARQVDNNALQTLAITPAADVTFSFELTVADCPDVDTWYMLTIYVWDSAGDLTLKSVTFKRIGPSQAQQDEPSVS